MNCPCGGTTKSGSSQVKTLKGAREWLSVAQEEDLPITVDSDTCEGCGRLRVELRAVDGRVLLRRG